MPDVLLLLYFTTRLLLAFKDEIMMNYHLSFANTSKVKIPLLLPHHDPQREAGENSPLQLCVWRFRAEKSLPMLIL